MAYINIHNIADIKVKQTVEHDTENNLGTYDVITIILTDPQGNRENITVFGNNKVSLPGIVLKEDTEDGTVC